MEEQNNYTLIALAVYFAILIYFVLSTKKHKSIEDHYSRGTGAYSALFIAVAMAVTMIGPADALALSQNGLNYGIIWAIFPIGAALAQFTTGTLFASKIKLSFPKIKTIGGIFEIRCSKSSTVASGTIAFIQAIAFSGVLILAGGQVLETFMGLKKELGMIITALFVGGYTSYRGMLTVMKTDALQAFLMIGMLILLIVAIIMISMNINVEIWNEVIIKNEFKSDYNFKLILTMFFGYFLGELLLPTYCIRASVSKDNNAARKGFIYSSLILIIWYIIITCSGSLGQFVANRNVTDDIIILDVIRSLNFKSNIIINICGAFVFLVFISLIHSTFDSFLNNGANSFSHDILGKLLRLDSKQKDWLAKQATIGISVLGLAIAIWKNDLIDILFLGYTVWVPTILPSLIWIILKPNKQLSNQSFLGGFFSGVISWYIFEYICHTPILTPE
ncbi:MAG: hypothetical protein KAX05_15730 [Bacteroidales bacterium]|nr:hypothetical protein [Bacteroidales bacterium]